MRGRGWVGQQGVVQGIGVETHLVGRDAVAEVGLEAGDDVAVVQLAVQGQKDLVCGEVNQRNPALRGCWWWRLYRG